MDIEGILARYGIDIRDCPDRANLIAMYRSIERLEEQCFAMQQDIRRLNHEIYVLQEQSLPIAHDPNFPFGDEVFIKGQSSHASEPSLRPALQTSQASAPREDFTPGAI
jgi:hypothetical protein